MTDSQKLALALEALQAIKNTCVYGSPAYTQGKALAFQHIAAKTIKLINSNDSFDFNNDADAFRHDILLELTEQN